MKQLESLPFQFKRQGEKNSPNGGYFIPHIYTKNYLFHVIFSEGEGWEHLSVTLVQVKTQASKKVLKPVERCPTWPEMVFLKDLFWNPTECVVQYHPPMSAYVNNHPFCLHLWKPSPGSPEIPTPPDILVGLKSEKLQQMVDYIQRKASPSAIPLHEIYAAIYEVGEEGFDTDIVNWEKKILKALFV